jgi:hypothetical protein
MKRYSIEVDVNNGEYGSFSMIVDSPNEESIRDIVGIYLAKYFESERRFGFKWPENVNIIFLNDIADAEPGVFHMRTYFE